MITVYDANTNQEALREIELVRPSNAGSRWKGIPHGELVDTLKSKLEDNNFKIEKEQYSLNKDKTSLVGAFDLQHPNIDLGDEQGLSIGFSTNNSMKKKLQIFAGSKIFVCTNGCVTGEVVMERKHTIRFDLMVELDKALVNYMQRANEIPLVTEGLKTFELTQRQSDLILMQAGRFGYLPWSRIGQVEKEYRNPTYADHNVKSSWGLLNAFTHIVKQSPPHTQMQQINQFRSMLPVAN